MTNDLNDRIAGFDQCVMARDLVAAEEILHPEFALVLTFPAPAVMHRERWMEVFPDYVIDSWEVQEQRLDLVGGTAAAMRTVDMRATVLGQDRSGVFVISDIWLDSPGGWRLWRRHSTPLTAGAMPD